MTKEWKANCPPLCDKCNQCHSPLVSCAESKRVQERSRKKIERLKQRALKLASLRQTILDKTIKWCKQGASYHDPFIGELRKLVARLEEEEKT